MPAKLSVRLCSAVLCLLLASPVAAGSQREELLELKNTILNLVDQLVANKIITPEQAEKMKAEAQAKVQAQAEASNETVEEPAPQDPPGKKVVRVPYVPEFVKEDIRNEVKAELRKEVHDDVVATAKQEKWGTAEALPEWVNRFRWYGDIRFREEGWFMDDENQANTYPNFLAINLSGGITGPNTFLNFTENRHRQRLRLRLGFDARATEEIGVHARFGTGVQEEPLSLNQTQGRGFAKYSFTVDRAFLRWAKRHADDGPEWLVVQAGRIPNPFLHSDMVWDPDLAFEGVSAGLSHSFGFGSELFGGGEQNTRVYLTLGASPYEETELAFDDDSSNDKWLLTGQLGLHHAFGNHTEVEVAAALYDYVNIVGKFNPDGAFGSVRYDWTAPRFQQKGNTMYPIKFDAAGNPTLFGLASDYTLMNVNGRAVFHHFAPVDVTLFADYVRNIAYDRSDIFERTGALVSPRNEGYHVFLNVGHPLIDSYGEWQIFGSYKYLQRDAVLDALTESNFHRGGTDAKGWTLAGSLGLTSRTWVQLRYMSSDQIDLAPLGIDILQFDINTEF
jgi:hypothetical protein